MSENEKSLLETVLPWLKLKKKKDRGDRTKENIQKDRQTDKQRQINERQRGRTTDRHGPINRPKERNGAE